MTSQPNQPNQPRTDVAVFFLHGESFISLAIEHITDSAFSHVALLFTDAAGNELLVECQGGTPKRIVPIDFYAKQNYTIITTDYHWPTVSKTALHGVGTTGYDYLEAGIAGIEDWLAERNLPTFEYAPSGNICSTSVALDLSLSDKVVTPGDVYKILADKYLKLR